jgi:hypothetical protein
MCLQEARHGSENLAELMICPTKIQKNPAGGVEKMKDPVDMLWQDKEIRFDNKFDHLELRRGEFLIDTMSKIEDTKGNNGDNGELQVRFRIY